MNKTIIGVLIAVVIVIIIGTIGFMAWGIGSQDSSASLFGRFSSGDSYGEESFGGDSVLLKEESISLTGLAALNMSTASYAVTVNGVEGDKLTVRQYGSKRDEEDDRFTITNTGTTANIHIEPRKIVNFNLFDFGQRRLEIDMPLAWIGDVTMENTSGGIDIHNSFTWDMVDIQTNSGGVTVRGAISGDSLSLICTSGGIELDDTLTAKNALTLKSNSGGIDIDGALVATNITIETTSGGIEQNNGTIDAETLVVNCNSGGIELGNTNSEKFVISATSGETNIETLSGKGTLNCNSGGIIVQTLKATGDVTVQSTSGGVEIGLPSDLNFELEANVTSGNINSDFPIVYANERENHGKASNGSAPFVEILLNANSGGIDVTKVG